MDYPDVTMVLQVGLTDKEQYIHRLGRTARAGAKGAGLLLLADYEAAGLLGTLHELPLNPAGPTSALTGGAACGLPGHPASTQKGQRGYRDVHPCAPVYPSPALAHALASIASDGELAKEAEQAYVAFLGFYNSNLRPTFGDKATLVAEANRLFVGPGSSYGLARVPVIPRDTLGKMG